MLRTSSLRAGGARRGRGLGVWRGEPGIPSARRADGGIWAGSHVDPAPTAGRFDGALGVVAAIEVAARFPDLPLAVVAFRAEETGPMGSRNLSELPDAFLEVHIEQGPVLKRLGEPLGVVTAIAGQARGTTVFEGRADHARGTPVGGRTDALVAAAGFVLLVRASAGEGTVATVGAIEVQPNAANVVAERVTVSIDARSAAPAKLDALIERIGFEPHWRLDPVAMSDAFTRVLPDAPELVS